MRPAALPIDKSGKKLSRYRSTSLRSSPVLHVRDRARDRVIENVIERQTPQPFSGSLARSLQPPGEIIIVAEDASEAFAKCRDHGSRQSGYIDQTTYFEIALSPSDAIREHQPTLAVGVENFDRLSRHRRDHVTRSRGSPVWHVFE